MKKYLLLLTMLAFVGCTDNTTAEDRDTIDKVATQTTQTTQTTEVPKPTETIETEIVASETDTTSEKTFVAIGQEMPEDTSVSSDKDFSSMNSYDADIDISAMTTTMAFAQSIQMMYSPVEYAGKTVNVRGEYYKHIMETAEEYHYILLMDETNCCQGIFEFILPTGVESPTDGEIIQIAGEYKQFTDSYGDYHAIEVVQYVL